MPGTFAGTLVNLRGIVVNVALWVRHTSPDFAKLSPVCPPSLPPLSLSLSLSLYLSSFIFVPLSLSLYIPLSSPRAFGEGDAMKRKSAKAVLHWIRARHSKWIKGFKSTSIRKAIPWRGRGHSVNRCILRIEIFCAHPLPKSQLWPPPPGPGRPILSRWRTGLAPYCDSLQFWAPQTVRDKCVGTSLLASWPVIKDGNVLFGATFTRLSG